MPSSTGGVPAMASISLEISNPCNERCVHCYRVCAGTRRGFLTGSQARSVLEQARELGAESVTITGGEALLNPEWRGIVSAADIQQEFRTAVRDKYKFIFKSDATQTS